MRFGSRAAALACVFLLLTAAHCPPNATDRVIVTAANLQSASADAYDSAKREEAAQIAACRGVIVALGKPAPSAASVVAACAEVGEALPYDPQKLHNLASPINALHESVLAAKAVRDAKGDTATAVAEMIPHLVQLMKDLQLLGTKAPTAQIAAANQAIGGSKR